MKILIYAHKYVLYMIFLLRRDALCKYRTHNQSVSHFVPLHHDWPKKILLYIINNHFFLSYLKPQIFFFVQYVHKHKQNWIFIYMKCMKKSFIKLTNINIKIVLMISNSNITKFMIFIRHGRT